MMWAERGWGDGDGPDMYKGIQNIVQKLWDEGMLRYDG